MFTTALKDIKSILAEFWMKEIEMKAEEFGSDEPCHFFLWVRSLRGEGKKIKTEVWLAMGIQCGYHVHSLNMEMIELYPYSYFVLFIYILSLWGTFVK